MSHWWNFQGVFLDNPKVAQQEIDELTILANGLLEFQRRYLSTHGEKTPVARLLSMIIRYIAENNSVIERCLIKQPYVNRKDSDSDIPF